MVSRSAPKEQGPPFSKQEDDIIIRCKEIEKLGWREIAERVPGRTKGCLQVRYSRKLHKRPGGPGDQEQSVAPRTLSSSSSEIEEVAAVSDTLLTDHTPRRSSRVVKTEKTAEGFYAEPSADDLSDSPMSDKTDVSMSGTKPIFSEEAYDNVAGQILYEEAAAISSDEEDDLKKILDFDPNVDTTSLKAPTNATRRGQPAPAMTVGGRRVAKRNTGGKSSSAAPGSSAAHSSRGVTTRSSNARTTRTSGPSSSGPRMGFFGSTSTSFTAGDALHDPAAPTSTTASSETDTLNPWEDTVKLEEVSAALKGPRTAVACPGGIPAVVHVPVLPGRQSIYHYIDGIDRNYPCPGNWDPRQWAALNHAPASRLLKQSNADPSNVIMRKREDWELGLTAQQLHDMGAKEMTTKTGLGKRGFRPTDPEWW